MSEAREPGPTPRRGTKLSRNEGRKLTATALNNGGVAFGLAAVLQPAVAALQSSEGPDWRVVLGSLMFVAISAALLMLAQRVIQRLEE